MAVRVLDEHSVHVGPDEIDVDLVLETAEVLIEEYGWRQGERPQGQGSVFDACSTPDASGNAIGFSLHDAINGACEKLSSWTDASRTPGVSSKDFNYTTADHRTSSLRAEATAAVTRVLPDGKTDIVFNDEATSADEIVAVLREARS